jgi:hypothetical protein
MSHIGVNAVFSRRQARRKGASAFVMANAA